MSIELNIELIIKVDDRARSILVTSSIAVWQYVKTISSIWIRSTQEIKTSDANKEQFIHYT